MASRVVHSLAFATTSAGKLAELGALLAATDLRVAARSLSEVAPELVVIEDGLTFASNAIKKASALADAVSMLSLADDSGLEVDALDGAPGIFSARYAGAVASGTEKDAANNAKLLAELLNVQLTRGSRGPWTARFRCALAVVDPFARPGAPGSKSAPIVVEGTCEGHIVTAARGNHGFGYDPLFVVEGDTRTLAEIDEAGKQAVSHRAKAFRLLVPELAKLIEARDAVIHRLT